ncbi:Arabinoxylan arabinofuranohydrolase [Paramyrothecium foliicola]|nr:Arabinoxylan arabinofuranohydrolase [Paramyrothecium foliicola]
MLEVMTASFGNAFFLCCFMQKTFGLPQLVTPTFTGGQPSAKTWTNPIVDGWYADPDGLKFGDTYWVYATVSISFDGQTWFDGFSSPDLVQWTKHSRVFNAETSTWATNALWAPCTVERNGTYYFYYTANNPSNTDVEPSGIGVASAATPGGPFTDLTDSPIVADQVNEANPMDQQVFVDDDNRYYLIWGGGRANIAPLADDMVSLANWEDGSGPKDITPNEGFVEGSFMLKRHGTYYFMWSEGGYGTPDYRVAYAMSPSITGPFTRIGLIVSKDDVVADGPGHHSVFQDDDGEYYVVYHRRIIGDQVADNRVIAIDRFIFNEDGTIQPVTMT